MEVVTFVLFRLSRANCNVFVLSGVIFLICAFGLLLTEVLCCHNNNNNVSCQLVSISHRLHATLLVAQACVSMSVLWWFSHLKATLAAKFCNYLKPLSLFGVVP